VDVAGVPVLALAVEAADVEALRGQVDAFRAELNGGVVVAGAVVDGLPRVVASVSPELVERGVHAGQLVKALAARLGGGGGGRPTQAEAGGKDAAALDAALAAVPELVGGMLSGAETHARGGRDDRD
jgi:alanyl-tRNA synthetase